jgi:hypothetical protein
MKGISNEEQYLGWWDVWAEVLTKQKELVCPRCAQLRNIVISSGTDSVLLGLCVSDSSNFQATWEALKARAEVLGDGGTVHPLLEARYHLEKCVIRNKATMQVVRSTANLLNYSECGDVVAVYGLTLHAQLPTPCSANLAFPTWRSWGDGRFPPRSCVRHRRRPHLLCWRITPVTRCTSIPDVTSQPSLSHHPRWSHCSWSMYAISIFVCTLSESTWESVLTCLQAARPTLQRRGR